MIFFGNNWISINFRLKSKALIRQGDKFISQHQHFVLVHFGFVSWSNQLPTFWGQKKTNYSIMCRRLVKMLHKGSGVGTFFEGTKRAIRLVNRGCTNRPFYHIVVAEVILPTFCLLFALLPSFYTFYSKCSFSYLLHILLITEFSWGQRSGNRASRLMGSNAKWAQWTIGCIEFWSNPMVVRWRRMHIKTGR